MYYRLGIQGGMCSPQIAGDDIFKIDFPSDLRAEALQVDQAIRATMPDVDNHRDLIPASVASGWDSFVREWAHYTEQDEGAGKGWLYGTGALNWISAAAVSHYTIQDHMTSLIAWRSQIKPYLPSGLSAPDPTPPGAGPLSALQKALPWAVIGLGIVVVAPPLLRLVPSRG